LTVHGGKTVSVVFPAYNEEQYIRPAIEDFLIPHVVDEVLVIDNNSRDRTVAEAAATRARVVSESRQGYGFALRRGLQEARGEIIILAEPDGTFIGRDVLKLLAYADDFDMVCGTRTTRELIWDQANMGWFLRVGNWTVAKLLQVLHGGPSLSDCGCTLRLTHRASVEQFVGEWRRVDETGQCTLGGDGAAGRLGLGVLGDVAWDPQARVRLRLGPLTRAGGSCLSP
jgi:glycosyltransferase involved in cell wall biosynthesis